MHSMPVDRPSKNGIAPLNEIVDLWRQAGEMHEITVSGSSMLPILREGDVLLVDHDINTVRAGEILVFRSGESTIAHRVFRVEQSPSNEAVYLTRGDSSPGQDPPVSKNEMLGKAASVRRGERTLSFARDSSPNRIGRLIASIMRIEASLKSSRKNKLCYLLYHFLGKIRRSSTKIICRFFLRWS
jgi:signal peptidase I